MKRQLIFFAFIFYIHSIYSQDQNPYQQPSIHITIHAETQSGLDQQNQLDQQAQHASLPTTVVDTAVQQKALIHTSEDAQEDIPVTIIKYTAGFACPPCALAYYLYKKSARK
jgi:hypothetical protein